MTYNVTVLSGCLWIGPGPVGVTAPAGHSRFFALLAARTPSLGASTAVEADEKPVGKISAGGVDVIEFRGGDAVDAVVGIHDTREELLVGREVVSACLALDALHEAVPNEIPVLVAQLLGTPQIGDLIGVGYPVDNVEEHHLVTTREFLEAAALGLRGASALVVVLSHEEVEVLAERGSERVAQAIVSPLDLAAGVPYLDMLAADDGVDGASECIGEPPRLVKGDFVRAALVAGVGGLGYAHGAREVGRGAVAGLLAELLKGAGHGVAPSFRQSLPESIK